MSAAKRGKERLAQLEREVRGKGVQLAYEKLQFAGLHLKSGLCWFKGRYYLFVDRLKPVGDRVDLLEQALEDLAMLPDPSLGPPDAFQPGVNEANQSEGQDDDSGDDAPEAAAPAEKADA
ncbi:MAG: hypothetical protein K9K65_11565 [Desulfarculaceae bacterium]|nr:hypothetical protein [Desulfarculaceae bacterium]MCF8046024.1 hypothetical protein [Desulfarculaceae bacterium]MCF8064179.1 hypothetical protein [Desulfarculaceae bacterium]MCF8098471.1 hypothetical protein [Desulfarculaceae bacterium]MCF8123052.1 hypothetical protein [Desulfarculaceae bacterium]